MSLKEIEAAIETLSAEELARFRQWFAEFDADHWDRQVAEDAQGGKLDHLIEQVREHKRQGRCTPL